MATMATMATFLLSLCMRGKKISILENKNLCIENSGLGRHSRHGMHSDQLFQRFRLWQPGLLGRHKVAMVAIGRHGTSCFL